MPERRTIAFIPGAFRPFGDHHMAMVRHYADMCDEVVVIVGRCDGNGKDRTTRTGHQIPQSVAAEIVRMCISDCGLDNVRCEESPDDSPVRTVFRDAAKLRDCDVVIGTSRKGGDDGRFDGIQLDCFAGNGVRILPPKDTAFDPVVDDGNAVSATDVRDRIDDVDALRTYLPVGIGDDTFERICGMLKGDSSSRTVSECVGAGIFSELLDEDSDSEEDVRGTVDEEETKDSWIRLDDEAVDGADCRIAAYNMRAEGDGNESVYNPKTDPGKAIDVVLRLGCGKEVEVFLDTKTKEWCASVSDGGSLTPDQVGQFLRTSLCRRICDRVKDLWPSADPFFSDLLKATVERRASCSPVGIMTEDGEFRKGNIDKDRSRGTNAAGEQIYTNSGRKIVTFSDFGVKHNEKEAYYCWPEKGKEFKWSQWADWTKIHPLLRMRFQHNSYLYGLSMSPLDEDDDNRGFRSYNLDLDPKLQYCTPIETQQMMDLTIVQKFLRNSYRRLKRFVDMPDEEIFERIGRPDKCTMADIQKTKHVVRNSMKAIRNRRADTYIYA